ncbi:MAG: hypothetical protein WC954_00820 [Sphaerochaeta sp.]
MGRRIFVVLLSFGCTFALSKVLLFLYTGSGAKTKEYLPTLHVEKVGTPLIGGVAFILGSSVATLFEAHLGAATILYPLLGLLAFGGLGLLDDWSKAHKRSGDGFTSLQKLALQLLLSALFVAVMPLKTSLDVKTFHLELGWAYYPLATLFIASFVNAVNITDGLDSLASLAAIPPLLLLLLSSQFVSGALLGGLIAFVWFNFPPAKTFMGDSGSHGLGGYLAITALLVNQEVLITFASLLFFLEMASSLLQIISIRGFGRKLFEIAPLHHAFEAAGFSEGRIVRFFVSLSWVFGLASFLIWG